MQHTVLSVRGLKGTMSEAELHIIRARLDGGIRNGCVATFVTGGAVG